MTLADAFILLAAGILGGSTEKSLNVIIGRPHPRSPACRISRSVAS